ncbi:hypothetical protein MnTg02_00158 [bacterium MnTg02]|nr:hypothetical protein MnTg02_00158 [bacterium MnTg02]
MNLVEHLRRSWGFFLFFGFGFIFGGIDPWGAIRAEGASDIERGIFIGAGIVLAALGLYGWALAKRQSQ